MIEDVKTGRLITTDVLPVEPDDVRGLGLDWRFDWRAAVEREEVFKLIDPIVPDEILGLLALERRENYVEVTLLESSPQNVGRNKGFRGIAGSLFAFAARLSFELGGEGFIAIDAKNELLDHYRLTYGFERIGRSQRMILSTVAAARLIGKYGGRPSDE
jgi:hypothetical protein